jgi:hypothetical protein
LSNEVHDLKASVVEACDYLRRGAALVAMAGDQNMALSMNRHAERILSYLPAETAQTSSKTVTTQQLAEALKPFAALGGPQDGFPAYQDLEDDVVVYKNSGECITAGDVRRARDLMHMVARWQRRAVETSETHPDTIRVEWLLRYVSGAEWRRLGAVYSAGMNRTALNDLMAPKEPTAFQDFVAGLPEEPKAPPRPQCDDCANAWPELCPRHLAAVKASGHPVMACIFRDGCRKFPACMTEDRCCGNDASIPKTR